MTNDLIGTSKRVERLSPDRRTFMCSRCRAAVPHLTVYDGPRFTQKCAACGAEQSFKLTGGVYVPEGFLKFIDGFIVDQFTEARRGEKTQG